MKRLLAAVPLACAALGLAACGGTSTGSPSPDSSSNQDQPSGSTLSSDNGLGAAPTGASGAMAGIDPCHLITKEEGARFNITGAQPLNSGGARRCKYQTGDAGTVSVDLREHQGIDSVSNQYGQLKGTTVAGKPAKEQQTDLGGCLIAVGITSGSRVDVQYAPASANVAEACATDEKIAALVAGKITS
ncbi:MAG: DUF3558 family protein [Sciscionella sp.]